MKLIKELIKRIIPWIDQEKKIYRLYLKSNKAFKKNNIMLAQYYSYRIYKKYGCYIAPSAQIAKELKFPHPIGIVIGEGVIIGKSCTIYQNVTIGRKNKSVPEYPTIGDNVTIYCNSTLIGNINIGDNVIIGCNSVVLKSVKENSKCVGVVK